MTHQLATLKSLFYN